MNHLDHLVIAADSLQQGVDFVRAKLGVDPPGGGFHQTMGTHNHLMQLGGTTYLEVIAIDPTAASPAHPRWFNFDSELQRAALRRQPRLLTWVMNTADIQQLRAGAGFDIGRATRLSRDALEWEFAITDDGHLLADGLLPHCIQWHSSPHPSQAMADLGCELQALTLHHNRPDWIAARLAALDASHLVEVLPLPDTTAPYLSASIRTPDRGLVVMDSRV